MTTSSLNEARRQNLEAELLHQAYQALPASLIANLVNGSILSFVMWDVAPRFMVLGWIVALMVLSLFRYLDYRFFRNEIMKGWHGQIVPGYFDGLAQITGMLWGAAGYGLFTVDSSIHLAFLAFLLAGMTAGAVTTLSVRRRTCQVFLLTALLPFILQLTLQAQAIYLAMGIMVLLYLVFGLVNANRLNENVIENIQVRMQSVENELRLTQQDELLQQTGHIGRIAGWYYNQSSGKIIGTPELYTMLELPALSEITLGTALSIYSTENRQKIEAVFVDAINKQQSFDFDAELTMSGGANRWTRVAGTPTPASLRNSFDLIGIVQDIGDRKAIELDLVMQQQQLEMAIASSNAGKFHYDGKTGLLQLDAMTKKLFNVNGDVAEVPLNVFLRKLPTDEQEILKKYFTEASGDFTCEITVPDLNRTKELRCIEIKGTAVQHGHEVSGLMFDITQRKAWEAAISQASKTALEMAQAKTIFLANMSHEIRTPMNGIIGMLKLMQESGLTPEQRRYNHIASHSAQSLLGIINDILDYSKLDADRVRLEQKPFMIEECVRNTTDLFSSLAVNKNLILAADVDPGLSRMLLGDPFRMEQILNNFVSNAIKYTETGSVHIKFSLIENGIKDLKIRAEVVDTGVGISKEAQLRLFTPFEQADNSVTRKYGGTGLGLSICKHLIELMDGEVGVSSESGQGTTFWFEINLPLADEGMQAVAVPEKMETSRDRATRYAGYRILLVEDNLVNQIVAQELLRLYGAEIDLAENGQEALEKYQAGNYDLIFMDVQMPVMGGLEATRQIRELEKRNGRGTTAIVAMTANAFAEDKANCKAAGMDDFLSKPFEVAELEEILSQWLPRQSPAISKSSLR